MDARVLEARFGGFQGHDGKKRLDFDRYRSWQKLKALKGPFGPFKVQLSAPPRFFTNLLRKNWTLICGFPRSRA